MKSSARPYDKAEFARLEGQVKLSYLTLLVIKQFNTYGDTYNTTKHWLLTQKVSIQLLDLSYCPLLLRYKTKDKISSTSGAMSNFCKNKSIPESKPKPCVSFATT